MCSYPYIFFSIILLTQTFMPIFPPQKLSTTIIVCPLELQVCVQQAPQNPKPVFLHQHYCALESSGYLVKM